MTPELSRVIALAQRRGARVRIIDQVTWDYVCGHAGWSEAPFSHISLALDECDRVVYVLTADANDKDTAGSVIHELGHLHATRRERARHSDEYSWMGWEIAVAREARVRGVWDLTMKDYGLGTPPAGFEHLAGMEWGEITRSERLIITADRLRAACRRGLVDSRGRAVWRRLPQPAEAPRTVGPR